MKEVWKLTRFLVPGSAVVGVIGVAVGILLQVGGASAWAYCPVIGIGLVVAVVFGAIWLTRSLRHGKPTSLAT